MAFQFPPNPTLGQLFEPIPGTFYVYDGTGWSITTIESAGGGSPVIINDNEPGSVNGGDQWFESDSGEFYMRYNNPDGTFTWIMSNAPVGVQGPTGLTGPQGPQGPQGIPGPWTQITQAAYDALSPPDPATLYVIIG